MNTNHRIQEQTRGNGPLAQSQYASRIATPLRMLLACALLLTLGSGALAAGAPAADALRVNINTASQEELQALPGIGASRAGQIIDLRKRQGPFKTVEDLNQVRGIGPAMIEKLRGQVTLTGKTRLPKPETGGSTGR